MSDGKPRTPLMYGSGLLGPSVMRVEDSVGKAKPKYDQEKRYGDRDILRRSAVESWAWREKAAREGKENGIEMIPVKVDGFQRKYNLESTYGGTMLDIEEDKDHWMNATLILGLSEEEKEKLDSSEENYRTRELKIEDVEPYLDEHEAQLEDEFKNNKVELYIGEPKTTDRTRNQTYHDRIRTGIDILGEIHRENIAKQFWKDFQETTYEKWNLESETSPDTRQKLENDIWTRVRRNDEIEAAVEIHGHQL